MLLFRSPFCNQLLLSYALGGGCTLKLFRNFIFSARTDICPPLRIYSIFQKSCWVFKILCVLNGSRYMYEPWIKLKNNSSSFPRVYRSSMWTELMALQTSVLYCFLPVSTKNISSGRLQQIPWLAVSSAGCSRFPDWLFQVLDAVNTNTTSFASHTPKVMSIWNPTMTWNKQQTQTPLPESAGELYRPSYLRLSTRLVPTFADRGVSCSQRGGSPTAVISVSRP
jgi:hypothetical protein